MALVGQESIVFKAKKEWAEEKYQMLLKTDHVIRMLNCERW